MRKKNPKHQNFCHLSPSHASSFVLVILSFIMNIQAPWFGCSVPLMNSFLILSSLLTPTDFAIVLFSFVFE